MHLVQRTHNNATLANLNSKLNQKHMHFYGNQTGIALRQSKIKTVVFNDDFFPSVLKQQFVFIYLSVVLCGGDG
jgi:hypothetical protein